MIDRRLARETSALLGTILAVLVEDQHDAMLRGFGAGEDAALARELVRLGEDFTVVAQALEAVQRRTEPVGVAQ